MRLREGRGHRHVSLKAIGTSCFGCVLVIALPAAAQQARMKVVLDTDIGTDIDDGWALGYALKSPTFDLVGVTVTDADTAQRARLACKLLYRLGRTDVPVAVGRQDSRGSSGSRRLSVLVGRGLRMLQTCRNAGGRISRRHHPPESEPDHADRRRAAAEHRRPGAAAPRRRAAGEARRPDERLGGPNAWSRRPVAEWNVKLAIPEAQAVYAASWPLTIVPLDSTTYVRLEDRERETLRKAGTPLVSRSRRCSDSGPMGRTAA